MERIALHTEQCENSIIRLTSNSYKFSEGYKVVFDGSKTRVFLQATADEKDAQAGNL